MKELFTLLLLCISKVSLTQDINFSQFHELPLLRNPALAGGYIGDFRITSAFRTQWGSVSAPYKTLATGLETKVGAKNGRDYFNFGLKITHDEAGDSKLSRTQFFPLLSYHKSLNKKGSFLSIGFMGGAVQQRFDQSNLRFDDQYVNGAYNPSNPTRQAFSHSNITYWDLITGLIYSGVINADTRFYIGGAYFHLTKPKVAFRNQMEILLNQKIMCNAGFSTKTNDYNRLNFYLDYFVQGGNAQGQGGLIYKHDLLQREENETISISGGIVYRWNDAIIPVVKLDYYNFGLGLSYDANMSKLVPASRAIGAYELTLSFRNFLNIRNSSLNWDDVPCPDF